MIKISIVRRREHSHGTAATRTATAGPPPAATTATARTAVAGGVGATSVSPAEAETTTGARSVPPGMLITGAWSWRLLALAGVVAVLIYVVTQLNLVVIPLLVSVILSALLVPLSRTLQRHRVPRWAAIVIAEVGVIVVIAGLVFLVVTQIVGEYDSLKAQTIESYKDLARYLRNSPLRISQSDIDNFIAGIPAEAQANSKAIVSGALSAGTTVGHLFAGALLILFSTLFILIDGPGIWAWTVRLFPRSGRSAVNGAGIAGWATLQNFIKVQILVALIDAIGIAGGAAIFGVPLALPLGVLVFLGSFIPVVGAVGTGAVAVFVALVYNGPLIALIILAVVLLVQEIEGHVLQPLMMGSAVHVHPLAVVLAVATGGFVIGIAGAFFAVPFVAVANSMVKYVASGAWKAEPVPDTPGPRGLVVNGEVVSPPPDPTRDPAAMARLRRGKWPRWPREKPGIRKGGKKGNVKAC